MATIDFDPKDRAGKPLGEIKHKILYLCPKYVSEETPEPYRQWLQAIDDSLDEEVDESRYDNQCIQEIFSLIERSAISPQELARMKEEYNLEEARQNKYIEGVQEGIQKGEEKNKLAIAENMLKKGLEHTLIAEMTGVSLDVLQTLVKPM
jgi:predicted transposase/invertase (TIGR01784 family)